MSINLNLNRLIKLIPHLPPYTRPTLHIAGTNGKGSVSALLTSILLSSEPPLSVGRYNSPHLVSIHDCITLDNVAVLPSFYNSVRDEVEKADKEYQTKLTNFEILTLVALLVFEKSKVDVVVLEVGMGGRLDATNVVPDNMIAVSALTAVDLDHQFFLGDTVIKIAQEKAGIARKGRPFVLGRQKHEGVKEAVKDVLENLGSLDLVNAVEVKVREWDERIDGPKRSPFSLIAPHATFQPPPPQPVVANLSCFPDSINAILPLYGTHQLDNLGTALTIVNELIKISESLEIITPLHLKQRLTAGTIEKGIKNVKWPGRLSFHTINVSIPSFSSKSLAEPHSAPIPFSMDKKYPLVVLVDGAHNSASAKTLGGYIASLLELTLESASSPSPVTTININITYILALSHSPQKTPLQTLSPIFSPKVSSQSPCTILNVKTSVALLRFTPPEGMPWVKPVPPKEMEEVVRRLVPDAELCAFEDSMSPSLAPDSRNCELKDALRWAAQQGSGNALSPEEHGISSGLIILAGSLYLVADFYRLLESTETI
jgi:folylpolyglutamate synthase/dihydrofolate synthase